MYMYAYGQQLLLVPLVLLATMAGVTLAIMGGYTAVEGQFPYAVSIQHKFLWLFRMRLCEGSLVSSSWVLSSAECFDDDDDSDDLVVVAGALKTYPWSRSHSEQNRQVKQVLLHPLYDRGCGEALALQAVALLQLEEPLELGDLVQPVRLPPSSYVPAGPGTVAGWGLPSLVARTLRYITLPILTAQECGITSTAVVCTGPLSGGFGPCKEPGSALVKELLDGSFMQIGMTTWPGGGCGAVGQPSTYLNLAHFSSFIESTIAVN